MEEKLLSVMSSETLRAFFESYAQESIADPRVLVSRYADSFVVSAPSGSANFKNDEQFLAYLTQVHEYNQNVGMQTLEVVSILDIPVGDHHAFVTVEWGARFLKTGDELIRFKISYMLRCSEGTPLILVYVSHEDQEDLMRARGLI
jgi:hypothetical protein